VQLVQSAIAIGSPAASGPLPQHLEQIAESRQRGKRISRAVTVATLSGWSLAIFAGLTLLGAVFDSSALLLGAALACSACFELRGARELHRLNARGPRQLARNQLFLAAIITTYAGYHLVACLIGQSPLASSASDPQVSQLLGSFDDMARGISAAFYGVVGLVGLIVPGLTALYYGSRKKHIEEFVRNSPAWIVELRRKGINV